MGERTEHSRQQRGYYRKEIPDDVGDEQRVQPVFQLAEICALVESVDVDEKHVSRYEEIYRHALSAQKRVDEIIQFPEKHRVVEREDFAVERDAVKVESMYGKNHYGQRKAQQIQSLRSDILLFHIKVCFFRVQR